MGQAAKAAADSPVVALVDGMLDLVPLPQAYVRIRQLVDDPEAPLAAVTEVVQGDPALTGRLLRLANSAWLGAATPVDTVEQAVRLLGMNQVHDMALATSAVGSLSHLRADLFDVVTFWRTSVYCGVGARELARGCRLPAPSRLFVSGLLHDIGSLVIAHELPEAFADCRAQARQYERPYYELERAIFGFDYAEVSAELMRQWNLPAALVEPVADHTHSIANLLPERQLAGAVLQVAATTARAAAWQGAESEPVPDYDETAITLTELDAEAIEGLMQRIDAELVEFLSVLMPGR